MGKCQINREKENRKSTKKLQVQFSSSKQGKEGQNRSFISGIVHKQSRGRQFEVECGSRSPEEG